MEETYTFKYDEYISKEFLTKISTNFVITKVIITLNNIVENDDTKYNVSIDPDNFLYFNINIIFNSAHYFNNKIEYACMPFLDMYSADFIDNVLKNDVIWTIRKSDNKSKPVKCEWLECNFVIKETQNILVFKSYCNDGIRNKNDKLIFYCDIFNNYEEFKMYILEFTKITEEQYKIFMKNMFDTYVNNHNDFSISFESKINMNNIDDKNNLIFNDYIDNL
jgi:hypothetical protein